MNTDDFAADVFYVYNIKDLRKFKNSDLGIIPSWANYAVVTMDWFEREEYEKMFEWCVDNFTGKYKFRKIYSFGLVDVFIENEDDAILFKLRWK